MGALVHLLFDPESSRPCIGASGGISGVIMFYALQYPQARLGLNVWIRWMPRWIEIPAWGAMALWLGLQILILIQQRMGTSNVAATAHLGGALAGFLAWILWRRFAWSPPEEPEPAG
jgi:membrane associated rhomboid family serine protease